ncbi:MAG: hypothetical protein HQL59_13190 [Magnetococcales bacterium]|nr:hypothetical protein [Magnetococcales bacterium]
MNIAWTITFWRAARKGNSLNEDTQRDGPSPGAVLPEGSVLIVVALSTPGSLGPEVVRRGIEMGLRSGWVQPVDFMGEVGVILPEVGLGIRPRRQRKREGLGPFLARFGGGATSPGANPVLAVAVTIGIVGEFLTKKATPEGGFCTDSIFIFLNGGAKDTHFGKFSARVAMLHGEGFG